MNLMDLFIKVDVDDKATGKIGEITGAVGKGLATAAKVGTAAIGVAASGVVALTKASIDQYAEYEQLVGGVDTLFKTSSQKVQQYAADAYKTAGLSANEYMETVTSFSASLLQSLGGDTEAAADYADQAIRDMSDNANKMGTDMGMIQNAYQGFAKQNYSMLDNLKLGYGGTASEMYRLLQRASELDKTFAQTANFSIDSKGHLEAEFADITQAIHIVQTEMGITGTTTEEAARTIQGSVASMKSAWKNLITGMADENADLDTLITQFVESVGTAAKNIIPKIRVALDGAAKLISELAPVIIREITTFISENLPLLAEAALNIVATLCDEIVKLSGPLADAAAELVDVLGNELAERIPALSWVFENLETVIVGVATALITLKTTMAMTALIDGLVKAWQAYKAANEGATIAQWLLNAALNANPIMLIVSLIAGLVAAIITLWNTNEDFRNAVIEIWEGIKEAFSVAWDFIVNLFSGVGEFFAGVWEGIKGAFSAVGDWFGEKFQQGKENAAKAWDNAKEIFGNIWSKTKDAFAGVGGWFQSKFEEGKNNAANAWSNVKDIFGSIWEKIKSIFSKGSELGENIIQGLKDGISNAWNNLKNWFSGLFDDLIGVAEKILGIASPSKVFKKIGGFTAEGFGVGFDDEFGGVKDDIENEMAFDDLEVGANIHRSDSYGSVGGGNSFGDVIINIDGAQYSDERSLATAVAEALQDLTDRREAVYA